MAVKKKAQIAVTFNWVYILIAGAVILLFFIGIVVKQKSISEENLATDVVRVMESIFTGAGVSEKTKNFVDISGLADYTLFFGCSEGVTEYGISGKGKPVQNNIDPIFAPLELKDTVLVLWSLPYKLPFKVIDFTFVSSRKSKIYLMGNTPFINEFINATSGFDNIEKINDVSEIDPARNYQFKIVDFSGGQFISQGIPSALSDVDDNKVTAVVFTGQDQVDYYQKEGQMWKKKNKLPVRIISLGGERDSARFATIFAGDDKTYVCSMGKAFLRLRYLLEVYQSKLTEMKEFYETDPQLMAGDCYNYISDQGYEVNVESSLRSLKNRLDACLVNFPISYDYCTEMVGAAEKLREANANLAERGDCLTLY
ncbi:hypothetical protein COY27_03650 [Candidatus Woesearchaeota archaeon CG_4_10_14_0_2_um_filter_33_13]|nr:MAG: hypothetical protein COY27_03650 [Candidatus Woesearchaeota archaeon CG_4_10_14_0_2_um_filter_33_13]